MGLEVVLVFCVVYTGVVLTGFWYLLSPPPLAAKPLRSGSGKNLQ